VQLLVLLAGKRVSAGQAVPAGATAARFTEGPAAGLGASSSIKSLDRNQMPVLLLPPVKDHNSSSMRCWICVSHQVSSLTRRLLLWLLLLLIVNWVKLLSAVVVRMW
jgi:hypothetical protein